MSLFFEISELWNLSDEPVFHRNVANDIYFAHTKQGRDLVLRLTPAGQRTREELYSELDWIRFLKHEGVKTCQSVASRNGESVESVQFKGQLFHAVVFEKIEGQRVEVQSFTEDFIEKWAQELARLHRLTLKYQTSPGILKRAQWNRDSIFLKAMTAIDDSGPVMKESFLELIRKIETYPKTDVNYGLVHGDLHTGNFFYINEEIHVFDFDDSCYHWFLYDLIIPVHTLTYFYKNSSQAKERVNYFINSYFKNAVKPQNLKLDLILFYKYRCALVHFWLIAIQKERNLDAGEGKKFQESIHREAEQALNPDLLDILE